MIKPGDVIEYDEMRYVVHTVIEPNDNLKAGRCALMRKGRITWFDCRPENLMARKLKGNAEYMCVSQSITDCPKQFKEAQRLAMRKYGITFGDQKFLFWGSIGYKINNNGSIIRVDSDLDSSG